MNKQIAIKFGDNDFTKIYRVFGEVLQDILIDDKIKIDKDYIIALWKESCYGLYILFQNQLDYDSVNGRISTGEYLKTRLYVRVYLDDEVDRLLGDSSSNYDSELLYIDKHTVCLI